MNKITEKAAKLQDYHDKNGNFKMRQDDHLMVK